MAKEDFLKNSIKERIIEGLRINYLGYVTNKEELEIENNKTLNYLQDPLKMEEVVNALIEHAKLELQNIGKIPGVKEIMEIVDTQKARNFAVDYCRTSI